MEFLWYRVITAASPGMAPQYAPTSQVEALERAMFLDGFDGITGARRGKSTRWREQWRDAGTVEIYGKEENIGKKGGEHF